MKVFVLSTDLARRERFWQRNDWVPFELCHVNGGHLRALDRLIESGDSHGIVCHDDAVFRNDFDEIVKTCQSYGFLDADIFQLGFTSLPLGQPHFLRELAVLKNAVVDPPLCYVIRRDYAKKVSKEEELFTHCIRHTLMSPIVIPYPRQSNVLPIDYLPFGLEHVVHDNMPDTQHRTNLPPQPALAGRDVHDDR